MYKCPLYLDGSWKYSVRELKQLFWESNLNIVKIVKKIAGHPDMPKEDFG